MNARDLIEQVELDLPIGQDDPAEQGQLVSVRINGEGADSFRQFMEKLAQLCNSGASREVGIVDPTSGNEESIKWAFDGDGNTQINVVPADAGEEEADPLLADGEVPVEGDEDLPALPDHVD